MNDRGSPSSVKIGFAGDIMLGRLVNREMRNSPLEYPWGNMLPLLQATDTNIGNLETTFTTSDSVVAKTFNFKADPAHAEALKIAHFSHVNTANNHIFDFSTPGFEETIATLKKIGIVPVGSGKDFTEACQPAIFTINGITFGLLGCTDNEPDWKAVEHAPGTFFLEVGDIEMLQGPIAALHQQVDIVILSIHWGPNMRETPPSSFSAFAHKLITLGVDLIHGHSAHIFQRVEPYGKGLILYDTGDFVDDYAVDPFLRNDLSFLFEVEFTKEGWKQIRLVPTQISDCQVNQAEGEEKVWACRRMKSLSKSFGCLWQEHATGLILNQ